jgi:hypothetical protein
VITRLAVVAALTCAVVESAAAQADTVVGSRVVANELIAELEQRALGARLLAEKAGGREEVLRDSLDHVVALISHCFSGFRLRCGDYKEDALWAAAQALGRSADSLAGVRTRAEEASRNASEAMLQLQALGSGAGGNIVQRLQRDLPLSHVDLISETAERFDVVASPRFHSLPRPDAVVLYQTVRGRERRDAPRSLPLPTNSPAQEIPVGCYYIWIRRGRRDVSDPERPPICIETDTDTVVLQENDE